MDRSNFQKNAQVEIERAIRLASIEQRQLAAGEAAHRFGASHRLFPALALRCAQGYALG